MMETGCSSASFLEASLRIRTFLQSYPFRRGWLDRLERSHCVFCDWLVTDSERVNVERTF
jgi:hypothetical protein